MTERLDKAKLSLVSEEAAHWFQLLQDPALGAEQRHEFVRWLKRSPLHVAEFLRLWHLDTHLRLAGLPDDLAGEVAGELDRDAQDDDLSTEPAPAGPAVSEG